MPNTTYPLLSTLKEDIDFKLSEYQEDILCDTVKMLRSRKKTPLCLLVEASAGSGKSTMLSLIALAAMMEKPKSYNQTKIVVFGKSNQLDLKNKVTKMTKSKQWAKSVVTAHALGYKLLRAGFGWNHNQVNVNNYKYHDICLDLGYTNSENHNFLCRTRGNTIRVPQDNGKSVKIVDKDSDTKRITATEFHDLVNRARQQLHCSIKDLIQNHYYLNDMEDWYKISVATAVETVLEVGLRVAEEKACIDADDMIWISALKLESSPHFQAAAASENITLMCIDEGQDLTSSQFTLIKRLIHPTNGRLVVVGDRHQSIFGFRGVMPDGIDSWLNTFSGNSLPLPVTYRCPTSSVELVNRMFPYIKFLARKNAKQGQILTIKDSSLDSSLLSAYRESNNLNPPKCLLMARTNSSCFSLIKECIYSRVTVATKDKGLAKGLKDTIKHILDLDSNYSLGKKSFLDSLRGTTKKEFDLSQAYRKKVACLDVIHQIHDPSTKSSWSNIIDRTFVPIKDANVIVSTVHSAKGLEADIVGILYPEEFDCNWIVNNGADFKGIQGNESHNLLYVALTRSSDKNGLGLTYLITSTNFDINDNSK